jgi:AcrR family transcriptional regulator
MSAHELPEARVSLRERQKASTAELILEAVSRCLKDIRLDDLSFARVAEEAGIAERTIYRHFATKEALLDAWWKYLQDSIRQGPYPETAAALIAAGPRVFSEFDKQGEWFRASLISPQGREIAARANDDRVAAFRKAVRDGAGELPEPEFTRLCAAVQALYSAGTWLTMREVWGLKGKESGRAVAEAIEVLLKQARTRARKLKSEGKR